MSSSSPHVTFPYLLHDRRGNHYVKVVVTIPSEITEKQRELLLEFAKEASKVKEEIGKNSVYEGRQKSNADEDNW